MIDFHTGLVNDQVPGDIVECGAWRGGASIFSKGVVDVLDPTGGRKILVADTFVGFPAADKNDGVNQCINQIAEARLRHGSIMVSMPSTRRQLDGVALWSLAVRFGQHGRVLGEKGLSELSCTRLTD